MTVWKRSRARLLDDDKGVADPVYGVLIAGLASIVLWAIWLFGHGG
jgi:hypothetical protein